MTNSLPKSSDLNVSFRLATRDDDEAMVALKHAINLAEHAAYPTTTAIPALLDLSREAAKAGLAKNWQHVDETGGAYLVGEIGDQIVCCGCWYAITSAPSTLSEYRVQANIGGIVVSETARGQGLGRAIMIELENSVRAKGIRQMRLAVVPGNTPAERLYNGLGFEDFETIMIKSLG